MTGLFTALFSALTVIFKSRKPAVYLSIIIVLVTITWGVYNGFATRVTNLEFKNQCTDQKLDSINTSLIRIELGVNDTRRDVSDLKNTLIR